MGNKIIRFTARPNLKYPLQAIIYFAIRNIESNLISQFLKFSDQLLFTNIMFIGELFAGLIVYLYQKKFVKKTLVKDTTPNKLVDKILKKAEKRIKVIDSKIKIIFILFCCGSFDFTQFFLSVNTPQFINISSSLSLRLGGLMLLLDSAFYYFVLSFPILKHQKFCIIAIGICSLIIIFTEFIFQEFNIFLSYGNFIVIILFSFSKFFFHAMIGVNEKYLYEFNNMDPFYSLIFEGLFGFLLTFFYDFYYNPLDKLIEFKKNRKSSEFAILIIGLIIFAILSGLRNLFRVNTTKIFTPMTTSAIEYILNPLYFILNFSLGADFITKGKRNYVYFFVNLILGFLNSIFGLAFNEFMILFFCGLDKDTHYEIAIRSELDDAYILKDLKKEDEDDIGVGEED